MRTIAFHAKCALFFAASVLINTATSQSPQPTVRQAPPALLSKFDINRGTVQVIDVIPDESGIYMLPISIGGQSRTMVLTQHEMRAPGFKLMMEDAQGLQQVPTPACVTYRGSLVEDPSIRIAATIVDDTVTATVFEPGAGPGLPGKTWVVQPINSVQPNVGPSLHIVFEVSDNSQLPYQCGNFNLPTPPTPSLPGNDVTLECDIAIEGDREFWILNGSSVTNAQNDVTSVMNAIEFIYDRDCDIQYNITQIIISTTAVYTSNDASTLLNQFRSRWNSVNAGVPRDVAHLMTGRQVNGGTIGLAFLGVICNQGNAYGLSESRYTNNFSLRTSLTSHELGHNWNADHCNQAPVQNPCYIMCASNGGCGSVTQFSPSAISEITSFASTRNCLAVVPTTPVISTLTPSQVSVFSPGIITLTGSGFNGVTSYQVGNTTYTSGFSVSNDSTMTVSIPQGQALGFSLLRVTNASGVSNVRVFFYNITSPPKLELTSTVPSTGGIASFDYGGTPGRQWFLVLGISNQTTPFQGYPLLSNPLLLTQGTFSGPLGIDGVQIPVPPGLGLLIFRAQILEADPTAAQATGTSNVRVIILL